MTRRMIAPLLFGLIGAALLIGLGVWQMQRLQWKQGVLAEITARITAAPVALPASPDPTADLYLPVQADGRFTGQSLRVLASRKMVGPGYRIIAVFETAGRRVLVDAGFAPEGTAVTLPTAPLRVTGNLHWPAEVDGFTPAPDLAKGLWFARDLPAMAAALQADPVLIVARDPVVAGVDAMPLDGSGIPNDHLGYALTWFSLAAGWLGMTVLFLWRIRRRNL